MKTLVYRLLISTIAVATSILVLGFAAETAMRISRKGLIEGALSYFSPEVEESVLGVSDWVIADPEIGYRLNPDKPGINDQSMKEAEVVVPKPAGTTRIIVLGDSLPFGGNPGFVDLLKERFRSNPSIEILNASTPGYTTYQELKFLERYILPLEPDLVVLIYCMNDNHTFLHRFDEEASMLWTKQAKEEFAIKNATDKFISRSYFLSYLKLELLNKSTATAGDSEYPWDNEIDFSIAWKDYSWPDFDARIRQMQESLKQKQAALSVVVFPLEAQLELELYRKNPSYVLKPQYEVQRVTEKYGIPHLDLYQSFYDATNNGSSRLYTDGIHLSEDGHREAAWAIEKFLLMSLP